jgi:mannonate dehydratase
MSLLNNNQGHEFVGNAQKLIAKGYRNVLGPMGRRYGKVENVFGRSHFDDGAPVFDRDAEIRKVLDVFETFRKEVRAEIGLGVDVHSLLDPPRAVQFAKDLEHFRLFYCEDLLAPEDQEYYARVRSQCSTPLAMGELWNNPSEWRPLIENRSIDYIRHHVSHAASPRHVRWLFLPRATG